MTKTPILWIAGSDWWAHNVYSEHRYARLYAQMNCNVLFVNSISIGTPSRVSVGLLKRIFSKLISVLRWMRRVQPNLYVLSPVLIPAWSNSFLVRFNTALLLLQLRLAMRIVGMKRPIGVFSIPTAAILLGRMDFASMVYYVKDRFSSYYEQMAFTRVEEHDAALARECDAVACTSHRIYEEYAAEREGVYWLPHGVHPSFFIPVTGPDDIRAAEPPVFLRIPHPRIVYWGQVNSQLDEPLLETLAKRNPSWHFVLIGMRTAALPKLRACGNVHFIPKQSTEDLVRIGRHADVMMNCRTDSAWNRGTCPTKLREYLATGNPVVSQPIDEIQDVFPGVVYEALDAGAWEGAIRAALDEGGSGREARVASVAGYDTIAAAMRLFAVLTSTSHAGSHVTFPDLVLPTIKLDA